MWPFRRSQPKRPPAVDLTVAAAVPLVPLFEKREPFTSWRPPDQAIPLGREALIQVGVWGYQLFVFLKLIERKFGVDVARAVSAAQTDTLNRLPDGMGDQLTELLRIIDVGVRAGMTGPQTLPGHPDVEVPIEYPIALSLLTQVRESPYFGQTEPPPDVEKLDFTLMTCLAHGKQAALKVFEPIVNVMEIREHELAQFTRPGLSRDTDGLWWSEHPGCFERHLQRKHRNPLFGATAGAVSQDDIYAARARDALERENLHAAVVGLAERLAGLHSPLTFHEANMLREEIDALLQRAAELGSSALDDDARLIQLQDALLRDMRHVGTQNPEAEPAVAEAEHFYRARIMGSRNSFLAQCARVDSPIRPEDVLPSLLSEDIPTIHATVASLAHDQPLLGTLREQARALVAEVEAAREVVPGLQDKLRALGAV